MSAIGNTKLDDNDDIGALLGQQRKIEKPAVNRTEKSATEDILEITQEEEEKKESEKLKHNRSAKFTDIEVEQLNMIMIAIGTDKVSKALRWCLQKVWETQGEEIEKIAQQKKKIGSL